MNAPHVPASYPPHSARAWLQRQPAGLLTVWAMFASFLAYGCMYAFRKPFSAAPYSGTFGGLDYKALLVLAQLTGYTISKFLGIKFVSETGTDRRVITILTLIAIAETALVLFPLVPAPWNAALLLVNGLPLGMVWGLVFSFLEGRRVTDLMALGLSLSLIFSSGWVKAVGLHLMDDWQVDMFWMPAITGALFLPLLLLALWMLAKLPPPDAADVAARTLRRPMDRTARRAFLARHWLIVTPLVLTYMGLVTCRDVRDTFQVDILRELHVTAGAGQLARTETFVGFAVIAALGLFAVIRSNRHAFNACCVLIALGCGATGAASLLFRHEMIGPYAWMTATGVGLYAAYIPCQALLFERLLANLRVVGTASFLITLCDSCGYLSTISLYAFKVFSDATVPWTRVLTEGGFILSLTGPLLMIAAMAAARRSKSFAPAPALAPV